MPFSEQEKNNIKRELVANLCHEQEVVKIIIFGSFLTASEPHDLDVAIFQTSDQAYLPLAMRYRSKTRKVSERIALDILPIKADANNSVMLDAIAQGEVVYER